MEELLDKAEKQLPSPATLQALRAIQMREHLDTPEARRLLEAVSKGTAETRQTREAKAALERLAK